MLIKDAKFVISSADVRKCPEGNLPEYAFIGRSNVGKSSLINMLTGYNNLAMTSATPGKTMLINHFIINNQWYLVDLPGYGYARRGKDARETLRKMIESYVLKRQQMTNLFVTKLDKLGVEAGRAKVEAYKAELMKYWEELPPIFMSSSVDRRGRDEILDYIDSINKSL